MESNDIKELTISYEKAIVLYDAVQMLKEEALKTLKDNDDLIAPLKREAEATIQSCSEISNIISVSFDFDIESDFEEDYES